MQYAMWVHDNKTFNLWHTYNKEVVKCIRKNFIRKLQYKGLDGRIMPSDFTVREIFIQIEKSACMKESARGDYKCY